MRKSILEKRLEQAITRYDNRLVAKYKELTDHYEALADNTERKTTVDQLKPYLYETYKQIDKTLSEIRILQEVLKEFKVLMGYSNAPEQD